MKRTQGTRAPFARITLIALAAFGVSNAAAAPSQRTFVASYGSDASATCALAAPCRSFNAAIAQTSPGGEVVILDTAGYGPMVINKAIKVIGPSGVYGGISVLGGGGPTTGIVINAGDNDDVILRGLDVSGVTGPAPLPQIGIDIQNAGGVHIEKSSIGNFNDTSSACVNFNTAKTVRVYVVDSFLRECRVGIVANGTAAIANSPSLVVDNTRFERQRASVDTYGLLLRNQMTATVRNSQISRATYGVLAESTLDGASSNLFLVNSQITRVDHAITVNKTATGASTSFHLSNSQVNGGTNIDVTASGGGGSLYMSLLDTQVTGGTSAINFSNSGVGHSSYLKIMGGLVAWTTNGITLSQSAPDVNTRMYAEVTRATVGNITNSMITATATTGSKVYVDVDSVMFGNGTTVVKTSGDSQVIASVVRSQIHNCTTVVDHGSAIGTVRIDGNHIVSCTNDFVNSGNPSMVSFNNNLVDGIPNSGGFVYIAPTTVTPR